MRTHWTERQVLTTLNIIKDSDYCALLHGAGTRRNNAIYKRISGDLAAKNIHKTHIQIRTKFKGLKQEYYTHKRNNTLQEAQEDNAALTLMEEIVEKRCVNDEETPDAASEQSMEEEQHEYDGDETNDSPSMEIFDVKEELYDIRRANKEEMALDHGEASDEEYYELPEQKRPRKRTYEGILKNFTDAWQEQQLRFMENLSELEERNFERIGQQQAALLRRHRDEIESILERDRHETERMLTSIVNRFIENNSKEAGVHSGMRRTNKRERCSES